jgi:flagellar basal body-associated protein FliL
LTSSPETTAENLEEHNDEKNSPNFWVIFVAVMIAVIAIISGFATFWHKKKLAFRLAEAQQSPAQCQSPPPPYYDHDHQVLEQDHLEETRQVMMQPPHGNVMTNTEVKTRAVPFQYPVSTKVEQ